jgi:phage tail sheath protein FI
MSPAFAPGVRREELSAPARPGLRTGVPAFIGLAADGPFAEPVELVRRADFAGAFGGPVTGGYLGAAVNAFFRNGGERCVVVRMDEAADGEARKHALSEGLDAAARVETVDLVCVPDLARGVTGDAGTVARAVAALQAHVLEHCDRTGDRMALLDSAPGASPDDVLAQRGLLGGTNGALYYPWVVADDGRGRVPPCGHVAGVYARGDARIGVHKAPANERLDGVLDVETLLDDAGHARLNDQGVNCIRAFPGRGIRVWGARTVADDEAWRYVNVRRVVLTLRRWMALNLAAMAFEPSTPLLWARIGREVSAYLAEQYRRGALRGRSAEEAFYVRCDASLNPAEVRELGMVVTEVGLAPLVPGEFVVVRFTQGRGNRE